jgi:hypothetical protein
VNGLFYLSYSHKERGSPVKNFIVLVFFIFLVSPSMVEASAQKDSACIRCHTDESTLKSLFIPPKIEAGEGEG